MVIDTSAVMAILQAEPEAPGIAQAILSDATRLMSAGNVLEAAMLVFVRYGEDGSRDLDLLVAKLGIEIVPFSGTHADLARRAFCRFGKGIHPAGLNFGDCMAYALSKDSGEPLLFKGSDFSQTDIPSAAY